MLEQTGSKTFPKNYINGKFIGGNSDLQILISKGLGAKMEVLGTGKRHLRIQFCGGWGFRK